MQRLREMVNCFNEREKLRWIVFALFLPVVLYRVWMCAQPPEDTSDLYRHLGYAAHIWTHGLDIYKTSPQNFVPEFWTQFWPTTPYIYPPGAMLFFSVFSAFGVGLFWLKLVFTLMDLLSSVLLARLTNPLCGLILFSMPVALWYTSHEGMYESLLLLPMMASVFALSRQRWAASGALWMLSMQIKQFPLLMAPLFLAEVLRQERGRRLEATRRLIIGTAIASVPFLPFYVVSPDIWLRPLQVYSGVFNPFAWNFANPALFGWMPSWLVGWNALLSGLIFLATLFVMFRSRHVTPFLEALPLASFWALLKTLTWGQFWYVIPAAGIIAGLHRRRGLVLLFLVLHWLQCGRSLALMTGPAFGVREYQETIDRFSECMWTCDYRFIEKELPSPTNISATIDRISDRQCLKP